MTKSIPFRLIATLLLAIPFILFTCQADEGPIYSAKAQVFKDSTPAYRYFEIVYSNPGEWQRTADTLNMYLPYIGKSMLVDEADEIRRVIVRQFNKFAHRAVRDSVKLKK